MRAHIEHIDSYTHRTARKTKTVHIGELENEVVLPPGRRNRRNERIKDLASFVNNMLTHTENNEK